jgi:CRP-like cAMP-binding protein
MLQATHALEKRIYAPGQPIIQHNESVDYFHMVVDGMVDVVDGETAVAQLTTNQFFGEIELINKQNAIATVRAGNNPVELALLPKQQFCKIIDESPPTIAYLKQVAQERHEENQSRRQIQGVA